LSLFRLRGCAADSNDLGISGDDFDIEAKAGAVFDDRVLEAGVDPGLGYRRISV